MNPQHTLDLLRGAMLRPLEVTAAQATEMLRALTEPSVRDATIALAVGRDDDAAALIHQQPAGSTTWLTCGPIDAVTTKRALPLINHLEAEARTAGKQYLWAPVTIHAYLDWATGHPISAARRLTDVPSTYSMAALLKHLIAHGAQPPRLLQPSQPRTSS